MPIYFAIVVGSTWIKFVNFFHATRTVGPLLKIIRKMSSDIANFLSLAGLMVLLFACVAMIIFNSSQF